MSSIKLNTCEDRFCMEWKSFNCEKYCDLHCVMNQHEHVPPLGKDERMDVKQE